MFNIIITIGLAGIYGLIRFIEIEEAREWEKCMETDWNEYYANI